MVIPTKLASAKCIAVLFSFDLFIVCFNNYYLFIYLFTYLFVCLSLIVCLTGPQRWLC